MLIKDNLEVTLLPESYIFKLMVLGDAAVGKTSLIRRFIENKFEEGYLSTIGVDFLIKDLRLVNGTDVRLVLWDVAGQSKYTSFKHRYYNGANGLLIVFDVTNTRSCINVELWLRDAQTVLGRRIPFLILANKIDKLEQPFVPSSFLLGIVNSYSPHCLKIVGTSAKTGCNVEEVFTDVANFLVKEFPQAHP